MSITKTRHYVEKSGCGLIVSIIIGIVMLLGIVLYGQSGRQRENPGEASVAFSVGDFQIRPQTIEALTDLTAAMQGAKYEVLQPIQKAQVSASTITQLVAQARIYQLAKQSGVNMDETAIKNGINDEIDMMVANLYGYLSSNKQLPEKMTQEEFKKLPVVQQQSQEVRTQLEKMFNDENQREILAARYVGKSLDSAAREKINPTDADLKSTFDTYNVDGISFAGSTGKIEEIRAEGEKIAQEVKAKGFDAVVKEIEAKKNPAITVFKGRSIPRTLAAMIDEYKPLIGLKAGDISGFIPNPGGGSLYKVNSIKNELPPDFEKNKEQIKTQYIAQTAAMELQKKVQDLDKTMPVKWSDMGYKAIYDYAQAPRTKEGLLKVAEEAKSASENSTTIGIQQAMLARYAAVEEAWQMAKPEDRKDLKEPRAEAIAGVLSITESVDLRLELFDLYYDLKLGDQAYEQLQAAAETNNGFGPQEVALHGVIKAKLQKLTNANMITAAQKAAVQKELDRWVADKAENDKLEAEQAKFEAEQAKKDKEEAAKLEAEEKARLEAEKKSKGN